MVPPTDQSKLNPYEPPEATGAARGFVWTDVHAVQYVLFMQLFCLLASLVVIASSEDVFVLQRWLPQFLLVVRYFSIACTAAVAIISIPILRWLLLWRLSLIALAGSVLAMQLMVVELA